jgi:hypothetical protein
MLILSYLPYRLVIIDIDHFNLRAVCDIQPPCGFIDGKVVLAPLASQRDSLQQVVTGIGCRDAECGNCQSDQGNSRFHNVLELASIFMDITIVPAEAQRDRRFV